MPRGGPNGGDGGRGGSIILQADANINTLAEFRTRKTIKAGNGENGKNWQMAGADAPVLVIPVPVGTIIFDQDKKKILGDLSQPGAQMSVAEGGRGGYGNEHFKSSTRQAPGFAELGEPGQERICLLELKLVADVGLIGLPSVGKSTLISRISNARPKIAAYPFTTIIPNLGVITMKAFGGSIQQSFVVCDLPGLIEGATEGKGLGIQFLKHVARNRVLVHILDLTHDAPNSDYSVLKKELKKYDKKIIQKPTIIAFNKADTLERKSIQKIVNAFKRSHRSIKKVFVISAVSGEGLRDLIFEIWQHLEKLRETDSLPLTTIRTSFKIFRPLEQPDAKRFEVLAHKKGKKSTYEVRGKRLEQIVIMTDFRNPEAVARVYDVCEKMGIDRELRRNGAKFGDEVIIGRQKLIYRWD